jgi:hypothetical protein
VWIFLAHEVPEERFDDRGLVVSGDKNGETLFGRMVRLRLPAA